MSLQDDYFELDAELKGDPKRRMRRIWSAFCRMEAEVEAARDCVRFVRMARGLVADGVREALAAQGKPRPRRKKPCAASAPSGSSASS